MSLVSVSTMVWYPPGPTAYTYVSDQCQRFLISPPDNCVTFRPPKSSSSVGNKRSLLAPCPVYSNLPHEYTSPVAVSMHVCMDPAYTPAHNHVHNESRDEKIPFRSGRRTCHTCAHHRCHLGRRVHMSSVSQAQSAVLSDPPGVHLTGSGDAGRVGEATGDLTAHHISMHLKSQSSC